MPAQLLRILGKVQGVFYRESMRREAERLGVLGWVRNRGDGSVEAWIQGSESRLHELRAWCRRGPSRAEVRELTVEDQPEDPALSAFCRRATEE